MEFVWRRRRKNTKKNNWRLKARSCTRCKGCLVNELHHIVSYNDVNSVGQKTPLQESVTFTNDQGLYYYSNTLQRVKNVLKLTLKH